RARALAGRAVGSPGAGRRLAALSGRDERPGAEEVPMDDLQAARRHPARGVRADREEEAAMSWSVGAGLEGKGVVVTGAAGGIGAEVARAFAQAGAHVCAVDVKDEGLAALMPTLSAGPHRSEA